MRHCERIISRNGSYGISGVAVLALLRLDVGLSDHGQAISAVQPGPAEIVRRKLCNLTIAATMLKPRPRPLMFRLLSER
jgi:hypothetical protein